MGEDGFRMLDPSQACRVDQVRSWIPMRQMRCHSSGDLIGFQKAKREVRFP